MRFETRRPGTAELGIGKLPGRFFHRICGPGARLAVVGMGIALTVANPAARAQNIVQNGSFEHYTSVPLAIEPWVPVKWDALLGNWDNAPDGVNYILVNTIYQDLHTVAGQSYKLSFDVAADLYMQPSAHVIVSWGGQSLMTAVTPGEPYDPQQNRYEQIVWNFFSTPVTATGPLTRLQFTSADNISYLFDDVRVTVVPEPSLVSLWVGGVLLAGWKGRPRTGRGLARS
jgi:hypothetical protein